jgi:hypothetical protein
MMTQQVAAAEGAILRALNHAGGQLTPSELIETAMDAGDVPFTEADIVEAIWRLRQKGQLEVSDEGVIRELVAA